MISFYIAKLQLIKLVLYLFYLGKLSFAIFW